MATNSASRKFIILFGSIFGGVGLLLLFGGAYFYDDSVKAQKDTILVKGRVVDLSLSYGSKGSKLYTPVVDFELNNQTYTIRGSVASSPPDFEVGEEVELFLKPNQPQEAKINSFVEKWLMATILGSMGIIFTLIGTSVIWSAFKP